MTLKVEPGQLNRSPSNRASTLLTGSSKRSMKYSLEESRATTVPPASTHCLIRCPPLISLTSSFFFLAAHRLWCRIDTSGVLGRQRRPPAVGAACPCRVDLSR